MSHVPAVCVPKISAADDCNDATGNRVQDAVSTYRCQYQCAGVGWRLIARFLMPPERWRLARTCWTLRGHPMQRPDDATVGALHWPTYKAAFAPSCPNPRHVSVKVAQQIMQPQIDTNARNGIRHLFPGAALDYAYNTMPSIQRPHIQWTLEHGALGLLGCSELLIKLELGWSPNALLYSFPLQAVELEPDGAQNIVTLLSSAIHHGWQWWKAVVPVWRMWILVTLSADGFLPTHLETELVENVASRVRRNGFKYDDDSYRTRALLLHVPAVLRQRVYNMQPDLKYLTQNLFDGLVVMPEQF